MAAISTRAASPTIPAYPGPWIWSEADVVYRFSEFLEAEFPRRLIHTEFKISRFSVADAEEEQGKPST